MPSGCAVEVGKTCNRKKCEHDGNVCAVHCGECKEELRPVGGQCRMTRRLLDTDNDNDRMPVRYTEVEEHEGFVYSLKR